MPLGSGGGVIRTQAFRLQSLGSKPVLLILFFVSNPCKPVLYQGCLDVRAMSNGYKNV